MIDFKNPVNRRNFTFVTGDEIKKIHDTDKIQQVRGEVERWDSMLLHELDMLNDIVHFYICGGFLRAIEFDDTIEDIDIYLKDGDDIPKVVDFFEDRNYERIDMKHAIKMTDGDVSIDIITAFGGDIKKILSEFDFTVCMLGFDWRTGNYYRYKWLAQNAYEDSLDFNMAAEYPISSLRRITKYTEKGYWINPYNLTKILLKIRELDMSNEDVIRDQFYFYSGQRGDDITEVAEVLGLVDSYEK